VFFSESSVFCFFSSRNLVIFHNNSGNTAHVEFTTTLAIMLSYNKQQCTGAGFWRGTSKRDLERFWRYQRRPRIRNVGVDSDRIMILLWHGSAVKLFWKTLPGVKRNFWALRNFWPVSVYQLFCLSE